MLLAFYHSQDPSHEPFSKEFHKAADRLDGQVPARTFAQIDASQNFDSAVKFQVSGFPHLVWFDNSRQTKYFGALTTEAMATWVNRHSHPDVVSVSSCEELLNELSYSLLSMVSVS